MCCVVAVAVSFFFVARARAFLLTPIHPSPRPPLQPKTNPKNQINELAQVLDCVADILWCSVCGCLLTQQHVELDARDKAGGALAYGAQQQQGGGQHAMHAPAPQRIAMGQGAAPPQAAGYPPQYGAAPSGYPQMQR